MKTDQLINILSTNLEPVKRGQVAKTLALALIVGGAAAFCVMLGTVGLRSGPAFSLNFLVLKLLFTLTLLGIGTVLLAKLARPTSRKKTSTLAFLPFLVIALAGVVALGFENPMMWGRMLLGMNWVTCLMCIPLFAIVPFIALIWFLRKEAPTDLRRTGAIAGLVAGALGATAYAFHCPDDSVPFVAIWYGTMLGLCALVGALLGPRLLRW